MMPPAAFLMLANVAEAESASSYPAMQCAHLSSIRDVRPRTPSGCEEYLATGDHWVHLRLCLMCGHVGCCDDSKNRYAREHAGSGSQPIVRASQPCDRRV